MKLFLRLALVFLVVFAAPFGAYAKKKKQQPDPSPTPMPAADPSKPVEALGPYIMNLEQLLALDRPKGAEAQPIFSQTSGLLLILRQGFVGEQEKAAPDAKNKFAAAINTCDLINAALDERNKTLGNLDSSQSVAASGKMEEQARKDNLTQGIHGDGFAKAVGSVVERDREKQSLAIAHSRSVGNDNALSAMAANQWNQRAADWKQRIAGSYSQIK